MRTTVLLAYHASRHVRQHMKTIDIGTTHRRGWKLQSRPGLAKVGIGLGRTWSCAS